MPERPDPRDRPGPPAARDDWDAHWQTFRAVSETPATRYRWHLVLELLEADAQGRLQVLEIGSGLGGFAEALLRRHPGAGYLGLELSRAACEAASRRVPRARFLQVDLLLPPEPGWRTDFPATHAVCSEVLEHLDAPLVLLRNAMRFLGPRCQVIVTVPHGPVSAFDRHIGHRRHYSPEELRALLTEAGLEVSQVFGAGFPFLNLYRLLTQLRGQGLIADVVRETPSLPVRIGSHIFGALFRANLRRWGWQSVAVAHTPGR